MGRSSAVITLGSRSFIAVPLRSTLDATIQTSLPRSFWSFSSCATLTSASLAFAFVMSCVGTLARSAFATASINTFRFTSSGSALAMRRVSAFLHCSIRRSSLAVIFTGEADGASASAIML